MFWVSKPWEFIQSQEDEWSNQWPLAIKASALTTMLERFLWFWNITCSIWRKVHFPKNVKMSAIKVHPDACFFLSSVWLSSWHSVIHGMDRWSVLDVYSGSVQWKRTVEGSVDITISSWHFFFLITYVICIVPLHGVYMFLLTIN